MKNINVHKKIKSERFENTRCVFLVGFNFIDYFYSRVKRIVYYRVDQ